MAAFFSSLAFRLLPQLLLLAILPNPTTIFASKRLGFSIDLIHRDSTLSPLYDPSSTLTQRAEQAALRSMLRSRQIASWFANSTNMISSPVMPGSGEYLMKLSLGTPSRLNWAIMDTGSDLIWTMCRPCVPCFGKTQSMFDPLQSSTYKSQSCSVSSCMELNDHLCTSNQLCGFHYSYGDKSSIAGILASETLLFDNGAGTIELQGIVFGCVHNEGAPNPALLEVPGIVGLGGGPLSLVNQIGSSIDQKFAYCLPPNSNENSMGQLKFGKDAEFSCKEEVQHTPMAPGGPQGTYYVLNLIDISVGNNRLNIQFGGGQTTAMFGDARSIIIDSGTPLTYLAKDVYDQVAIAVANVINHERLYPPKKGSLCYHVEHNGEPYEGLPEMTFHFANADWNLPPSNIFRMVESGIACLAIEDGEMPIFGNVAQQNMHVKYDLGMRLLSFAPAECTQG